jgi:cytochrome c55X
VQALTIQPVLKAAIISIAITMTFLAPPVLSTAQELIPGTLKTKQPIVSTNANDPLTLNRQKELIYMVQQDCGACHGMTLKGGLGPDLLPERVSVLPKEYLINVITHGRQDTPMPPWGPLLTQQEITWIAEQLQLGHLAQKRD